MLDFCIEWPAYIDSDNYGQINSNSKGTLRTARIVLAQRLDRQIREGCQAHHCCYCRSCVNPLHIDEKPIKIHANDRYYHDRPRKPILKLTKEDIYLVKYLLDKEEEISKISQFIKVTIIEENIERIEPLPVEVIILIKDYKVWDYIHLMNWGKVEALQKLDNYYTQEICIEANWGKNNKYYPVVQKNNKTILAHRYAYQFGYEEPIPNNKVVRHRCDNNRCIRASHLIIGTQADNMADKIVRKRCKREILLDNHEVEIAQLIDSERMSFNKAGIVLAKKLGHDKAFDHNMIKNRYNNYKHAIMEEPKVREKTQKELLKEHADEIVELKNFKNYTYKKIASELGIKFLGKPCDQQLIKDIYINSMDKLGMKIPKTQMEILIENRQQIVELLSCGKSKRAIAKIFTSKFNFKNEFTHTQIIRALKDV